MLDNRKTIEMLHRKLQALNYESVLRDIEEERILDNRIKALTEEQGILEQTSQGQVAAIAQLAECDQYSGAGERALRNSLLEQKALTGARQAK
jgi:hypothetical protein